MERLFYTYVDNVELYLHAEDVAMICHSGSNDAECRAVAAMPYMVEHLKRISYATMMDAIESYGIELDNKDLPNLYDYMVWIAAWNIFDDEEYRAA